MEEHVTNSVPPVRNSGGREPAAWAPDDCKAELEHGTENEAKEITMMLTVKEVAERLRMSRTCVYQLVESGKLACYRIGLGRGAIRIALDDLAAFVESCRDTGNAQASVPVRPARLKHLRQ